MTTARVAEAAVLAGERHHPVQAAFVAVHANEAVRQYAAIQKLAELPFDKGGHRPIPLSVEGKKVFKMTGY